MPSKEAVQAKWGTQCMLMGTYCTGDGRETIDHWVPTSKGGPNVVENLRPSCLNCNQEKGNMTPSQWEVWTGHSFGESVLPLPRPRQGSNPYEFATLSDLQENLRKLRGEK